MERLGTLSLIKKAYSRFLHVKGFCLVGFVWVKGNFHLRANKGCQHMVRKDLIRD